MISQRQGGFFISLDVSPVHPRYFCSYIKRLLFLLCFLLNVWECFVYQSSSALYVAWILWSAAGSEITQISKCFQLPVWTLVQITDLFSNLYNLTATFREWQKKKKKKQQCISAFVLALTSRNTSIFRRNINDVLNDVT